MKKFWINRHRLNVLVVVLAVSLFVLPTVITLRLMDKKAAEDEKFDSMVYGVQKTSENRLTETTTVSPLLEGEEPLKLEKDTTHRDNLMMATEYYEPVDGQASESDAADEDVDKSENESTEISTDKKVSLNGKKVYLTFDDGPSCYTEDLLKVLRKYDVKATFFVVAGSRDYEKQLKEIASEGHVIGLHSYTHVYSEIYSNIAAFQKDVRSVHDWVKNVTGIDSKIYRFPGGSGSSPTGLDTGLCVSFLDKAGYEYYDWNALSGDAEGRGYSASQMVDNVMYYVRANEGDSIVLLHDQCASHSTVDMLPTLIETLESEGYELCVIDQNAPHAKQYIPEIDGKH